MGLPVRDRVDRGQADEVTGIGELIARLSDPSAVVRENAREALVARGQPSAEALTKALSDTADQVLGSRQGTRLPSRSGSSTRPGDRFGRRAVRRPLARGRSAISFGTEVPGTAV